MTPWQRLVLVACLVASPGSPSPGGPPATVKKEPGQGESIRTDNYGDPLPPGALLRLGTMRHRYLYRSYEPTVRLSDGKTALTSTPDEVRWVDLATGRLTHTWPLPKGYAACGFSPDGGRLAPPCSPGSLRARSARSGPDADARGPHHATG